MPVAKSPRKGSLQYWPRKRARKFLPRVNWNIINSGKEGLRGFICYKVGMKSALVKDTTENSMTKGKRIAVPVTILECPPMKILSVRFYKNGTVKNEIINDEVIKDKDLKRKLKLPKSSKTIIDKIKLENYDIDDIHIVVYSQVKNTNIKKTPDISELKIYGESLESKFKIVKDLLRKEINISDIFEKGQLIDVRGLTTGRGLSGPVKRFGITLKSHKSEKGRRKPGSLGPWHPARTTFRAPQAGQLGMFSRVICNNKILDISKPSERAITNIKNYGDVKTDYLIVRGSIQGASKRQLIITPPYRPTRKQIKKKLELLELK